MDVRTQKVGSDTEQGGNSHIEARLLLHLAPGRRQEVLMKFHVSAGQAPFASFERSGLPPAQQKPVGIDDENGDDRNRISVEHEAAAGVRACLCSVAAGRLTQS